jgi:hypothetical protein
LPTVFLTAFAECGTGAVVEPAGATRPRLSSLNIGRHSEATAEGVDPILSIHFGRHRSTTAAAATSATAAVSIVFSSNMAATSSGSIAATATFSFLAGVFRRLLGLKSVPPYAQPVGFGLLMVRKHFGGLEVVIARLTEVR